MNNKVRKFSEFLENDQAVIITSDANRFYLSGFKSSDGILFITNQKAYFLIDFRYFEKAKNTVTGYETVMSGYSVDEISELCKKNSIKTLFVETAQMSVAKYKKYKNALDVNVVSDDVADKKLAEMRSIKTSEELELIKKAQKLTDETFSFILDKIVPGKTEKEIALEMEYHIRKASSEGVAFDFIVVSGKNSSLPHGIPTDKKIEKGDFVTMDFGAVVGGFRSDMTRTVAIGNVSDEQRTVYNTVLKAQSQALEHIKAGVVCKDVDKIARDIIYNAGYKDCFGHGLGHSVGIEIHEMPSFNTRCETVLKSGTVITVEPGIYIENKFGVRIEDMVFVTENGCVDITESKKDLIVL